MARDRGQGARQIERALVDLLAARRSHKPSSAFLAPDSAPQGPDAFRALTEARLQSLERELAEVKGRINGLIFLVVGTAITQIVLRLLQ